MSDIERQFVDRIIELSDQDKIEWREVALSVYECKAVQILVHSTSVFHFLEVGSHTISLRRETEGEKRLVSSIIGNLERQKERCLLSLLEKGFDSLAKSLDRCLGRITAKFLP